MLSCLCPPTRPSFLSYQTAHLLWEGGVQSLSLQPACQLCTGRERAATAQAAANEPQRGVQALWPLARSGCRLALCILPRAARWLRRTLWARGRGANQQVGGATLLPAHWRQQRKAKLSWPLGCSRRRVGRSPSVLQAISMAPAVLCLTNPAASSILCATRALLSAPCLRRCGMWRTASVAAGGVRRSKALLFCLLLGPVPLPLLRLLSQLLLLRQAPGLTRLVLLRVARLLLSNLPHLRLLRSLLSVLLLLMILCRLLSTELPLPGLLLLLRKLQLLSR